MNKNDSDAFLEGITSYCYQICGSRGSWMCSTGDDRACQLGIDRETQMPVDLDNSDVSHTESP